MIWFTKQKPATKRPRCGKPRRAVHLYVAVVGEHEGRPQIKVGRSGAGRERFNVHPCLLDCRIEFAEAWKPTRNTTPNRDVTALRDEYEGLGRSHVALIETGRRKLEEARRRLDKHTQGREEDRKRIALAIEAVKAREAS